MMTLEDMEKKLKVMEKRLQDLEGAEEIRKLHTDYIYCLDNWEFEKMANCFAENAEEEGIFPNQKHDGKAAIKKFFQEIAVNPPPKGGHMLIMPVINVKGNKAEGHCLVYRVNLYSKGPSGPVFDWFGPSMEHRYDCEYVKENGAWKFKKLKFTATWPELDPH